MRRAVSALILVACTGSGLDSPRSSGLLARSPTHLIAAVPGASRIVVVELEQGEVVAEVEVPEPVSVALEPGNAWAIVATARGIVRIDTATWEITHRRDVGGQRLLDR